MALSIKSCDYFIFVVENYQINTLLSSISEAGVSQLAFKSRLLDSNKSEFTIFPNKNENLLVGAAKAGITPTGPFPGIIIKSNTDEPGELAQIFKQLETENIKVLEASGIADMDGHYGVVLYLKESEKERALKALQLA